MNDDRQGVQVGCSRAGCIHRVPSSDFARAEMAAQVAGFRPDDDGRWWCHVHATTDTLPSPSMHDEETPTT